MMFLNFFQTFFFFYFFSAFSFRFNSFSNNLELTCNYKSCPYVKPDMLNVHLICHTHDDVGWLKTVDQYYYGSKNYIQRAGVKYILDSVISELVKNKERRFIYVETAFFWKWWTQQNDSVKELVTNLVNEGRLEFVGGGWSMNDEATTHYSAIIDQMTLGHKKLSETFKKCGLPKVAWQIDPFGHSREQALLFAQMFFDGLFLGRIDWKDKLERKSKKDLEFVWKTDPDSQSSFSFLFTGILPNTYSPPKNFCFDDQCTDDPIIDDAQSTEYNVHQKVDDFIKIARLESQFYLTNNIIMTMGNDFNYHHSKIWFENLDKLIFYVNEKQKNGSKVNVFYSTPSCYLYSLNQANKTWKTKFDDFFPYSSDSHAYWTGYYSSRPSLKYYERFSNNFLQIVKQLQFLSQIEDEVSVEEVYQLQQAMGILQHHDAVSGTEKQHVAYNYAYVLSKAIDKCKNVINEALNQLTFKEGHSLVQNFCFNLNISECFETEKGNNLAISFYNPLGQNYSYQARLPVSSNSYSIFDWEGKQVQSQLLPVPKFIMNIPGRKSQASQELVFNVNLPKLGFVTYFAIKNNKTLTEKNHHLVLKNVKPIRFRGKGFYANFNSKNGSILSLKLDSGSEVKLAQKFQWYWGMAGNNSEANYRASGAYIFRPNGTARDFNFEVKNKFFASSDFKYSEVHQTITPFIGQAIRVYEDAEFLEFNYRIGPIPIYDQIGKEIVCKFTTDLKTHKTFYTDSNGRHLIKRTLKSSKVESEPISKNYYPINSRIVLRDETKDLQLTLLTDRSLGGSSLSEGSLEIMVHRRLLYDDAFGVDEALNETGIDGQGLVITGKFYLFLSNIKNAATLHRNMAQKLYMAPLITFANCLSVENYKKQRLTYFSALNSSLPNRVHILSMELWKPNLLLLRLEHFFETNELLQDEPKSVRLQLKNLFKHIHILGIRETTLSVNKLHSEAKRLSWRVNESMINDFENKIENRLEDFTVTLKPMQIRTLLIAFKPTLNKNLKI